MKAGERQAHLQADLIAQLDRGEYDPHRKA
jgi:hypothetical protein